MKVKKKTHPGLETRVSSPTAAAAASVATVLLSHLPWVGVVVENGRAGGGSSSPLLVMLMMDAGW